MKIPEKYLEVERPVRKSTVDKLEKDLPKEFVSSGCCLTIGGKHYERDGKGNWIRLAKVINPEWHPDIPTYYWAFSFNDNVDMALVQIPIGINGFHKKMMIFFKLMWWKYRNFMQVEGLSSEEDYLWETTKKPRYKIDMDGAITKIPEKILDAIH